MSLALAFDVALCALALLAALWTVAGRDPFASVISFMVYGLLLAVAWVRLAAPDVALAEAAIGAGLTGLLLLSALARSRPQAPERRRMRPFAVGACAAVGLGLGWAMLELSGRRAGLQTAVAENLAASGVANPVTAVLLNFRGYDTLLESVVLLVALLGVWSLTPDEVWGGRPGLRQHVRADGVLAVFGRFLPPIGIVVGLYMVWAGSSAPGGAFQAGAVLAAVWLLAMLSAAAEPPRLASRRLRLALVAGPALFLAVGVAGIAAGGAFLAYPDGLAKILILAIEGALTLSIAAILALLVMGPAARP